MLKVLPKTVLSTSKTLKSRISTKIYSKSLKIDSGSIGEIFLKLKLAFRPNGNWIFNYQAFLINSENFLLSFVFYKVLYIIVLLFTYFHRFVL